MLHSLFDIDAGKHSQLLSRILHSKPQLRTGSNFSLAAATIKGVIPFESLDSSISLLLGSSQTLCKSAKSSTAANICRAVARTSSSSSCSLACCVDGWPAIMGWYSAVSLMLQYLANLTYVAWVALHSLNLWTSLSHRIRRRNGTWEKGQEFPWRTLSKRYGLQCDYTFACVKNFVFCLTLLFCQQNILKNESIKMQQAVNQRCTHWNGLRSHIPRHEAELKNTSVNVTVTPLRKRCWWSPDKV